MTDLLLRFNEIAADPDARNVAAVCAVVLAALLLTYCPPIRRALG